MGRILYIISKPAESWQDYQFILATSPNQEHKTVVFLEGVVGKENISADRIYQVNDGTLAKEGSVGSTQAPYSISYRDLLDLIFTSDTSVVF